MHHMLSCSLPVRFWELDPSVIRITDGSDVVSFFSQPRAFGSDRLMVFVPVHLSPHPLLQFFLTFLLQATVSFYFLFVSGHPPTAFSAFPALFPSINFPARKVQLLLLHPKFSTPTISPSVPTSFPPPMYLPLAHIKLKNRSPADSFVRTRAR